MQKFTTLKISANLERFIYGYATAESPKEMCAVLIGNIRDEVANITEVIPIKNISTNPKYNFLMDPQEFYDALAQTDWIDNTRTNTYLGIVHSHPQGPPCPSDADIKAGRDGKTNEGAYLIHSGVDNITYSSYFIDNEFRKLHMIIEK